MRRGFTLLEMSLVVSLLSLVVAVSLHFGRTFDANGHEALAQADAARAGRAISEELRRDLRTMDWLPGDALALANPACRAEYVVEEQTLIRKATTACGGTRAIARHVTSATRNGAQVVLRFSRLTGRSEPFETRVLLGMPR